MILPRVPSCGGCRCRCRAASYVVPQPPSSGDVADAAHPDAERVAGQVREREVLDLDDLQGGGVGAAADRALLGDSACLSDGRVTRQVLEDLVRLATDLGDGGADGVGDGLVV